MQYYSTNHQSPKVSFKEATAKSEAPDGGLYMPERLPIVPKAFLNNISGMTLKDIAFVISSMFIGNDIPPIYLKNICDEVFSIQMPIYEIEPGIFIMEMFHGPTRTVKDFGAGFLTRIMKSLLLDNSSHSVMVATTGYSGAAIAKGFHDIGGTEVFVLYPRGTSRSHLDVINSMGDNIHAIEVNGTIENCKEMISRAFEDKELSQILTITSANSTNIGYLLPYISVFFYAYSQIINKTSLGSDIYMSIPTGNCGCLLAGSLAKKMGLPMTRLIAACNGNGGFYQFMQTGKEFERKLDKRTFAYGLDSPTPGNLPRFKELFHGKISSIQNEIISDRCSDEDIAFTINDIYERCGYLLDPHSAVAYRCLKENMPVGSAGLLLATAHPSRSIEIMTQLNRGKLKLPYVTEKSYCCRPQTSIPPSYPALKKFVKYYCLSNLMQNRS